MENPSHISNFGLNVNHASHVRDFMNPLFAYEANPTDGEHTNRKRRREQVESSSSTAQGVSTTQPLLLEDAQPTNTSTVHFLTDGFGSRASREP